GRPGRDRRQGGGRLLHRRQRARSRRAVQGQGPQLRRMSTMTDPAPPDASLPADVRAAVAYLRSPEAIRSRAARVLQAGIDGRLRHFAVHMDRLDDAARYVADVIRETYPDLQIPYHSRWGHFAVG